MGHDWQRPWRWSPDTKIEVCAQCGIMRVSTVVPFGDDPIVAYLDADTLAWVDIVAYLDADTLAWVDDPECV